MYPLTENLHFIIGHLYPSSAFSLRFFFLGGGCSDFIDGVQESKAPEAPPLLFGVWDGNCEGRCSVLGNEWGGELISR